MNIAELVNLPYKESSISHPVLDAINAKHDLAKLGASRAALRLLLCRDLGLYDPTALTRIVDFGAGHGGSTFAVALLAQENGATVDAVEEIPLRAEVLKNSDLQSMSVRAHQADGIEWLDDRARDGEQFDLITACMLGPDFRGKLARELLVVSHEALVSGGKLLMYSDPNTMAAAREVCDDAHADYHGVESLRPDISTLVACDTIVITNP
jgi:SAM-dependent methyltransferase